MSFLKVESFLAITLLVLLPVATKAVDWPNPFLGGNYTNVTCQDVQCGRGRCEVETSRDHPFGFSCDCEDGWRRTILSEDHEDRLEFLPCIVPNCSIDYSCMAAPAPPPAPVPLPYNNSIFDPCNWVYCGEGTCRQNGTYQHTCECNPGSSNLLNTPSFPCYRDCAIGSDSCRRLGIRTSTSRSNPSSGNGNGNTNKAITLSIAKFNWIVVLLVSFATVMATGSIKTF